MFSVFLFFEPILSFLKKRSSLKAKNKPSFPFFVLAVVFLFSCQSEVRFASILETAKIESLEELQAKPSAKPKSKPIQKKEPPKAPPVELKPVQKEKPLKYKEQKVTLKAKKKRLLDILLVLDSSASMNHHLKKLGIRVFSLLDSISDYDWQIGFTTADHGDHEVTERKNKNRISSLPEAKWEDQANDSKSSFGKLMQLEGKPVQLPDKSWWFRALDQRILNSETANYEELFLYTVSHFPDLQCDWPPFCQKPMEQPLRSLKSAMERINFDNADLFRPEADFVSLIISNEEERLEDPDRATSAEEVTDTFNNLLKPLGKRFFAFNILVLDKECRESERNWGPKAVTASLGVKIGKLADLTGGENISICSDDYGPSLKKISKAIEIFVEQSVDIEESFVPGTLKVEFLDGDPIDWELVGNRLIFKREPETDREIKISYIPADFDR